MIVHRELPRTVPHGDGATEGSGSAWCSWQSEGRLWSRNISASSRRIPDHREYELRLLKPERGQTRGKVEPLARPLAYARCRGKKRAETRRVLQEMLGATRWNADPRS